jgi:hypothetical protein
VEVTSTCSVVVFHVGIQYVGVILSNVELNTTCSVVVFRFGISVFVLSDAMSS